ncbi:MAG: LamG domain-containing protein, partial [Hydrogenophaga sp.]
MGDKLMALSGWNTINRLKLTIAAADIDADLTDFPITVVLRSASGKTDYDATGVFDELGANSLKIAVEDGDTGNQCYVEVEWWDSTSEIAVLHVRVPTVSSSAKTVLYLYYDSTQADNSTYVGAVGSAQAQAVWDSNYVLVAHMTEDPSGSAPQMRDSTVNALHGTSYGSMTTNDLIDGLVGKALDFDGSDDYINYFNPSALRITGSLTVEAVIRRSGNPPGIAEGLVAKYVATGDLRSYALYVNPDGYAMFYAGSGTTAAGNYSPPGTVSVTDDNYHYIVGTFSPSTALNLYTDGADKQSNTVSIADAIKDTSSYVAVGTTDVKNTKTRFEGHIDEVRLSNVARSDAWINATYKALTDDLITMALDIDMTPVVSSHIAQHYGAGPIWQELEQSMGLVLGAYLEQEWWLAHYTQAVLEQPCGLVLSGFLAQPWGNAPVIQGELWQWYGDTTDVQSWISQRWGDAHQAQSVLEQVYNLPQALQSVLEQRYAITGTEVLSYIEQLYNLHGYDAVRAALVQPWMIAAAESLRAAVSAVVTVDGATVDPYHITVEWSADMYALAGELHFADQGTWLGIAEGDAATVACAGQTATMIVAGKRRSRRVGQTVYIVELASAAILLDEPYALPLLERWDGVLASTVAQELADYASITVDWQIIDDYVYDLYANNETPLAVLRKLAGEWGGVLRCELDGTLSVVYDYPYPPAPAPGDTWETVSPAATLTDQDNFFTAEES